MDPSITLSQLFLLCALDKHGSGDVMGEEFAGGIIGTTLIEMSECGTVRVEPETLRGFLTGPVPADRPWLQWAYDKLRETKNNNSLERLWNVFANAFVGTKVNGILAEYCRPLVAQGVFTEGKSLFLKRTTYIPNPQMQQAVVDVLMEMVDGKRDLDPDLLVLTALLSHAKAFRKLVGAKEEKRVKRFISDLNLSALADGEYGEDIQKKMSIARAGVLACTPMGNLMRMGKKQIGYYEEQVEESKRLKAEKENKDLLPWEREALEAQASSEKASESPQEQE